MAYNLKYTYAGCCSCGKSVINLKMSSRLILDATFSVNTHSCLICNDRGCGQKKYTNFVQRNLFLQNNMGPERKTTKPNITREQKNLKSRSNALHVSIQKTLEMLLCIFFTDQLFYEYFGKHFNTDAVMSQCCQMLREMKICLFQMLSAAHTKRY